MLFKIFHILFLFSLYSIKGNECTEKTTFSDYDDEIRDNECESLSGKDYYCYYDYTKQKCEAIYCNDEADDEYCYYIPQNSEGKRCLPRINKGGCEYKSCLIWQSIEIYLSLYQEDNKRCVFDSTNKRCKLTTCEELPNTECNKYQLYSGTKICAPYGNNCKVQTCSELSEDICESVEFFYQGYKCIYSDSKWTFSSCGGMLKSECGKFIQKNKAYKCYFDKSYDKCSIKAKDCEELSKNESDLFNNENNLEHSNGKKCTYSDDDGKCVLSNKNVEFNTYIILILLLLF